ncbi:MAG: UDP-N-acetylenolpyruvoylglucosamine reductase [delta proteobacterium ML8_F1]|nr:MAG: UDP-N-acetylenolpyruvoylglucosamine reductase [delta proteobacterium ML8_F1]
MKSIIKALVEIVGSQRVLLEEPLKNHTSFKIGGAARVVVLPQTPLEVAAVVRTLFSSKAKYMILGNGTNLLFPDEGYRGIVVKLAENLSQIEVRGTLVQAQAGALLSRLSKVALKNHLSGLEFASGIPGTLGGAVVMNAGAYGGEMKDVVTEVKALTEEGELLVFDREAMEFGYRNSIVKERGLIVLETTLALEKSEKERIASRMSELDEKRRARQPLHLPSAGSTFKRPSGNYAGKLIEEAGLRGLRYGGAMVSERHCGFVVNVGEATYEEVTTLMGIIQRTVFERFGINLEPEVKIIERDQS